MTIKRRTTTIMMNKVPGISSFRIGLPASRAIQTTNTAGRYKLSYFSWHPRKGEPKPEKEKMKSVCTKHSG
jgi:hypothetical protein